ncbi:MAG: hypothetical protein Q4P36_08625 [Bowdeniella nasicola]|nr:hypothetical protein [Bowdeniella nasicola]
MLSIVTMTHHLDEADADLAVAETALRGAYPSAWDGSAAQAYADRLSEVIAAVARLRTRVGYARHEAAQ